MQVAELTSLGKLLTDEGITPTGKAAAINDRAVPPALWAETILQPEDRILVFRAFYGG